MLPTLTDAINATDNVLCLSAFYEDVPLHVAADLQKLQGMEPPDPTFMLWASAYVVLKWTVGVWIARTMWKRA